MATTAAVPVPGRLPRSRRNSRWLTPAGVTAIVGIGVMLVIAIIAPSVWLEPATMRDVPNRWAPASAEHLFGTDDIGRDIFARVMVATRTSLLLTAGATTMLILGGLLIGLTAASLPRRPRRALVWLMDTLLAFPWLLLVLFFTVIWGATAFGAMMAIGLAGIPGVTRLVYNMAASVADQDFVRAARVVGVSPLGIMFRHVLPNISGPLLVQSAAVASTTLLSFAALSFLGLGVQPPDYDWGRLLNEGLGRLYVNPMAAIGPGIAVVFSALVLTMLADTLGEQPGQGVRAVARWGTRAVAPGTRAAGPVTPAPLAEMHGLRVSFPDGAGGLIERVRGVDLTVAPGEIVGIVGESGSGKSLTALALVGLIDPAAHVRADTRRFDGVDLNAPLRAADKKRLGVEIGVIFQDPLTSLNPALTIGRQLTEVPRQHLGMSRREARKVAIEGLAAVSIADPAERLGDYPYQFSGGMRQRAMIGMALTGKPKLIIADEPTTALDVTVQRQVLNVLSRVQRKTGAAIVFISHDIALVSGFCDRVVVMREGEIVEEVGAVGIREHARHPYTQSLIACLPDMGSDRTRPLPVIVDFAVSEGVAVADASASEAASRQEVVS